MFLDEARISLKAFLSAEGLITRDRHTRRVAGAGPQFGLEVDKDMTQFKLFTVSRTFLPPSFHREVMKNSAWWLDVYQETGAHTSREAARIRLMDAVST